MLLTEANRCLLCKKPRCKESCPISTEIPDIIELYKNGKIDEAGEMLFKNNPLSLICSIVCPHEDQCKGSCIRGIKSEPIAFHEIEKEISQEYIKHINLNKSSKKEDSIAIVGGGPAGITISLILAQNGYNVTLFDAHEKIGGVLRYGIPEYRLPNSIIDRYEEILLSLDVKIRPNTLIGPVVTVDRLMEDGYKAVFIATGVWNPRTLGIKGETLGNVHYAIDYLKSPEVYKLGNRVGVIGAGNVAMDAARVAKRAGAESVHIVYRKGVDDMPATKQEIKEALEDGVEFELFKAPKEISENGILVSKTENVKDESGRVITKILEGQDELFECDSVIIAVSQAPKTNIVSNTNSIETDRYGLILVDDEGRTTKEGVFSSGDVVTGAKTVVHAVAHAKRVAKAMMDYCEKK
ncbi:MAG: NAD(P)-dependent oxidoreductase [Clostridium sp.]